MPSRRRIHDPEETCCRIRTNLKMYGRTGFKVVLFKLPKLVRFALPSHLFSSLSYVPLIAKWCHHELSFSLRWACIYLSLVYTLSLILVCFREVKSIRFKSVVLMVITIDFILSFNLKRCLLEITVLISITKILCFFTAMNGKSVWKKNHIIRFC